MTLVDKHMILDRCRNLLIKARGDVVKAMPLLHKIFNERIYETEFDSFGEYVDSCGIDRGQASRLIGVYQHYVIEHGLGIELLNSANPERLYKARKLDGGAEKQLAYATTLSSSELNAALAVKENGEEHDCIPVCRICHRPM